MNLIFLLRAVADPEGSLLGKGGGVLTKSAQSAALGRVREWIPLLQVGARELPRNIFENWMQMVHSEPFLCAEFVLISPPKLCVIFAFKTPIYLMRDNFHLSFRGSYKAQEGFFIFSQ